MLDPVNALLIPARLHDDDAPECAYAAPLDQIASIVRPQAWDPWPRHTEHSGASIAVTLAAYQKAGGMPAASIAEDRKFFAALQASGARVRHAPEIVVTVSGRIVGLAEGGMADTIRRRLKRADPCLDDALEPAMDWWWRLRGHRLKGVWFRRPLHGPSWLLRIKLSLSLRLNVGRKMQTLRCQASKRPPRAYRLQNSLTRVGGLVQTVDPNIPASHRCSLT